MNWKPASLLAALLLACAAVQGQPALPDAAPAARDAALAEAVRAAQAEPAPDPQRLLQAMAALADHLAATGRYREAAAEWQRTLDTARRLRGPDHPDVVAALQRLGSVHHALGEGERALAFMDEALALVDRTPGPASLDVAVLSSNRGVLLRALGRYDEAAAALARAVSVMEAHLGPDHPELAVALGNAAVTQISLGRYAQALVLLERSGTIIEAQRGPEHPDLAVNLSNRASVLDLMGRPEEGLPLYRRSLAITEAAQGPDSDRAASVLGNLAGLLQRLGRVDEALETQERAQSIRERRLGLQHPTVALGLNNLAQLHQARGDLVAALPLLQRSLAIAEAALGANHPSVAITLGNLAAIEHALGRPEEALQLERRALALLEARLDADHPEIAASLGNLAAFELAAGRPDEARPLFERSLDLRERRLGAQHRLVAYSLNNLASLHLEQRHPERALPLLTRAREIVEALPAASDLERATGLHNEATALALDGQLPAAIERYQRAIVQAAGDGAAREALWKAQSGLGRAYLQLGRPDLAVLWGKEAVNTLQTLRGELATLDAGLQRSYLESRRRVYDELADLLIEQGRLEEAQAVLQMLKEHELHEGLLRAAQDDPRRTRAEPTGAEHVGLDSYQQRRARQDALSAERLGLERQARARPLTDAEAARLREITEVLMPATAAAMQAALLRLDALPRLAAPATAVQGDPSRLRQAIDMLGRAEPKASVAGVQYLVTEQRLSILLTLPGRAPLAYQQEVGRRELHRRIAAAQLQLRNPRAEAGLYRDTLQQLHAWLIEPMQAELRRAGVRTLMLSLDDQLRLLPFAALLDAGGRYLVQDYALSMFNEAAVRALDRPGRTAWRVAAMGLSEAVEDLPALTAVPAELDSIVSAPGLRGQRYLNAAFDRRRLVDTLAGGTDRSGYNVLHIASHFVLQPGLPGQSRLYLGDKSRLTLADIARADLRFGRFDLVTFSACETARGGGRDAAGQEMESLGAKAQNQGAGAVMATLWKVDDRSTARFMRSFYTTGAEGRGSKAEALRTAQLAMLEGRLRPAEGGDWRAPFHWAPFVLMGNWR